MKKWIKWYHEGDDNIYADSEASLKDILRKKYPKWKEFGSELEFCWIKAEHVIAYTLEEEDIKCQGCGLIHE